MSFIEIDGSRGVTFVCADDVGRELYSIAESVSGDNNARREDVAAHFDEFYDGTVWSVSVTLD